VIAMSQNPLELFHRQCPDLAASFDAMVEAQRARPGLDAKTKQLINVAIQTANRNPSGVRWHALMAKRDGATAEEVVGAVVMNLHLSGITAVLECLPAATEGLEAVDAA
jgi:AhpD family alkylhydroperoxidase